MHYHPSRVQRTPFGENPPRESFVGCQCHEPTDLDHIQSPMSPFVVSFTHRSNDSPRSWKELIKIIQIDQAFDQLSRSPAIQKKYDEFRVYLQQEWRSIHDYILCDKLGVERCRDPKNALWCADDFHIAAMKERGVVALRRNDFPYFVEDSIEHWVLWKLGKGSPTVEEIDAACDTLNEALEVLTGDPTDFIHWTNPPGLQSLPNIAHVHILYRNGTRQ